MDGLAHANRQREIKLKKSSLSKLLQVAAAGAMVLGVSFFGQGTTAVEAQARLTQAVPGTFTSSVVVANPSSSVASVTMSFVKSDGTAARDPLTFTVAAGASKLTYVPGVENLPDGRYSVVVDSDQNVVAIANLASTSPASATSYNGIAQADVGTTFYIPSVYRSYFGYTSSLVVQNAGTATANVSISYKNATGTQVSSETKTIPTNSSFTFDQGATSAGLTDGYSGSAVITSDQSVAAIFLVSLQPTSSTAQLSSARGIKTGASTVFMPVIYNRYYNNISSILVQNVDTANADVLVSYYSQSGAAAGSETATITAGASRLFLNFDTPGRTAIVRPASDGGNLGFNGSAVVTSTNSKNVVAVANIQNDSVSDLEAYNGFLSTSATAKTTCPSIFNNYFNNNTSLTIQNVDTVAANVTLTYTNSATSTVEKTVTGITIQPNATHFRFNPNDNLSANFNGSVTVTSTAAKIVALVNQRTGAANDAGDALYTYACANS